MLSVLKRRLLVALASGLTCAALLAIDPTAALLFRVVGLVGMGLFTLSVVVMLLTFRKARALSPWALMVSALSSIACTAVMYRLGGVTVAGVLLSLGALAGVLIGVAWALTNLLFVDNDAVRARGTLWFLAIWALTILIPQAVAASGARSPQAMAVLSFFGMGLALGNALSLIVRRRGVLRAALSKGVLP